MIVVIDLQLLQTPARHRGMGQYLTSLLKAVQQNDKFTQIDKTYALFSSNLKVDKSLLSEVETLLPGAEVVQLPLRVLEDSKDTDSSLLTNKRIVNEWLSDAALSEVTYLMPSVFQAEIYPVFPDGVNKCLIMYDLIPLQMHEIYSKNMRWDDYLKRFTQVFEADHVFCISKTTSNALQVYAGMPHRKLSVINGGPGTWPEAKKPKKALSGKFILMPTGNDVRKNNKNAVAGFAQFNALHKNEYTLVATSFFSEQEIEQLLTITPKLHFTGNVSNDELAWYFSNCQAVLFPTVLEGLGMPLLEAMVYDKPVTVSKIDVFEEISKEAPYYFNPYDESSISKTLSSAVSQQDFDNKKQRYPDVLNRFSWEASAEAVFENGLLEIAHKETDDSRKKIAILCPYPGGISAIGKFVAEMHPIVAERADVEYFFEMPDPIRELRPNVIGVCAPSWPITEFNKKRYDEYDQVIYHIGNGKHHSMTMSHALTMPGVVVLHDLNLTSIYDHMMHMKIIDQGRYDIEAELSRRNHKDSHFVTSLVNSQNFVVVHSDHAQKIVKSHLSPNSKTQLIRADLPVQTPQFLIDDHDSEDIFTIGLAGILANIKGLKIIEGIASDPRFSHDRIMIFGLNFAEPGSLDRLRSMPNVDIQTDLSDYTFQEKLKQLSVFVNYRTHYQGEASSATLEAMRYGVPVMVRSDFGWYRELPDNSVVKVASPEEIANKLSWLKSHHSEQRKISENARKATEEVFNTDVYVDKIFKAIWG